MLTLDKCNAPSPESRQSSSPDCREYFSARPHKVWPELGLLQVMVYSLLSATTKPLAFMQITWQQLARCSCRSGLAKSQANRDSRFGVHSVFLGWVARGMDETRMAHSNKPPIPTDVCCGFVHPLGPKAEKSRETQKPKPGISEHRGNPAGCLDSPRFHT